jgi:hypothetical protein
MLRRLRNLFRPDQLEAEIREELEFQTHGTFGNLSRIQDQTRAASTVVWLETLVQDLRYGVRQLTASPALSLAAVVSLALGIGANTAIFSLINAVMLQQLPVKDPGRLVLFDDDIPLACIAVTAFRATSSPIRPGSTSAATINPLRASAHFARGPTVSCSAFQAPATPVRRNRRAGAWSVAIERSRSDAARRLPDRAERRCDQLRVLAAAVPFRGFRCRHSGGFERNRVHHRRRRAA